MEQARRKHRRHPLQHAVPIFFLFLFLFLLAALIPGLYLTQEKFFYYWDFGGFQGAAVHQAQEFLESPITFWNNTARSRTLEYNYFYTLPLIPFLTALGGSRLGYVLSVSLVYQLTWALMVSAIGIRLIQPGCKPVFWSVAFLCLLTPIAWAPTLRGYPDVGAAMLLALAVYLFVIDLSPVSSNRLSRWLRPVAIGFILASVILFRRHFVHEVLAFFVAMSMHALISVIRHRISSVERQLHHRSNHRGTENTEKSNPCNLTLITYGSRIGLAGLFCLLTLVIFGRPVLDNVLTTNYGTLFASYNLPPLQVLWFFLSSYGWVTWLLVALGFCIGSFTNLLKRPVLLFVLLFNGASLGLWVLLARQAGIHYALHVATFVVLGLASFGWAIYDWLKGAARLVMLSGLVLFVVVNFTTGLGLTRWDLPASSLFSAPYAPLTRPDYHEVERLVAHLRQCCAPTTTRQALIYVVDSSGRMNHDLLIKAEQALYQDARLNVAATPQIDSRDFYPLELLMEADYVLLSRPLQLHLSNPAEQKVVEVVFEAFAPANAQAESWEIARDFQQLPEQFHLEDGATLSIYRRLRPTSLSTAIRTFAAMKAYIGHRPGRQPNWIVLSKPSPVAFLPKKDHSLKITFPVPMEGGTAESDLTLLYADEIAATKGMRGVWTCLDVAGSNAEESPVMESSQVEIALGWFSAAGQVIQEHRETLRLSAGKTPFSFKLEPQEPAYLVLVIQPNPLIHLCRLIIE